MSIETGKAVADLIDAIEVYKLGPAIISGWGMTPEEAEQARTDERNAQLARIGAAWNTLMGKTGEADALRYRWLRSHIAPTIIRRINKTIDDHRQEVLDATIDAYSGVNPSVVDDNPTLAPEWMQGGP